MSKSSGQKQTFESAMARLEKIVESMESGKMKLEDLIRSYEEGIKLVKLCSEQLDSAEKRIQIIEHKATGSAELKDFDPTGDGAAPEKEDNDVSLF